MNIRTFLFSTLIVSLFLTGCFNETQPREIEDTTIPEEDASEVEESTQSSSSTATRRETKNVTYQGTVRPAGVSIYSEGTHRLVLDSGKFILLEAQAGLDLNGYVNEYVEVFGAVRPTIEEGGIVMRMEKIRLKDKDNEQSTLKTTEAGSSSISSIKHEEENMDNTIPSVERPVTPTSDSDENTKNSIYDSNTQNSSSSTSTQRTTQNITRDNDTTIIAQETEDQVVNSVHRSVTSANVQDIITEMIAEDIAPERWTQQYCSERIGHCISIHKNWFFNGYLIDPSALWYMEISSKDITERGDGAIVLRLLSGETKQDGAILVENGIVTAYHNWTQDRHFEIIADARLEQAVRIIANSISAQ